MKCFDFLRWWILIRLTWNLSRLVPNSVEFLRGVHGKKLFRENFSEIFMQTKAILYQNLWNFALLCAVFILRMYCTEKIHTSTFICCLRPCKATRPQTNHKKKIRGRKARTVFSRKTGFVHSRSGTYYALLLGCFGLKFLPDVRHCVYWVLEETWAQDSVGFNSVKVQGGGGVNWPFKSFSHNQYLSQYSENKSIYLEMNRFILALFMYFKAFILVE